MRLNARGITAAELLVVLLILGVIATIAVPTYGNIQENSERDALIGESKIVEDQLALYCKSESDNACDVDWGTFEEDEELDDEAPEDWHIREDDVDGYLDGHDNALLAWRQNDR